METRVQYGDGQAGLPITHHLIRELSGSSSGFFVQRIYMEAMGGIEGGLFLSQLIFWHDKGGNGDGWFYKSYDEWRAETFITKYAVGKYADLCKQAGFLETEVRKANGAPTVYYKVDFGKFLLWIEGKVRNRTMESAKSNDPGSFEIERSYKQNITTENNNINDEQNSESTATTADDSNLLPFEKVVSYWAVSVSGKAVTKVQEEWLWSLYQEFKGELLLECIKDAARNNSRGGLPTYNFVRAICKRKRTENEASAQRRLALTAPIASPEYTDPAWEKLRKEIMDGNQRDS